MGKSGIVGFVSSAGFLEANTADGLRQCLTEEFSSIYIFHLRGNQRTQGEQSRREGGKIFGQGSRAPIAIMILVKNPAAEKQGQIYFHDIGDYLSTEEKLTIINAIPGVTGISSAGGWQLITPDAHGDWLKQRDDGFNRFIALGDKKGDAATIFENYSSGVKTQRDAWCYNASKDKLEANMTRMIAFFNDELDRFDRAHRGLDRKVREAKVDAGLVHFQKAYPKKGEGDSILKEDLFYYVYGLQAPWADANKKRGNVWLLYSVFNSVIESLISTENSLLSPAPVMQMVLFTTDGSG